MNGSLAVALLGVLSVSADSPARGDGTQRKSVVANGESQLPEWYLSHRTHAHTRLSVNSFCKPDGNATGTTWTCDDVFETAGKRLASLGVPAYVRHSHTGGEGLTWNSSTAPRSGWHPLVSDTGRNLPHEFLVEAKAAGVAVIFYHYMKCQPYFAQTHPDWVQRTSNGSALGWSRCPNGGLSTCVPAWRQTYIRQILELIEMAKQVGQEPAFYFDEYPSSPSGDFNEHCRTEFLRRFGYVMPSEPTKEVLAFNQAMTEQYFAELLEAIRNVAPRAAALVSITFAPSLDNHAWMNYTNTIEAGDGPQDVAKVEFAKGLVARPISSKSSPQPGNKSCAKGWSPPVMGRSPGSVLGTVSAASFEQCQMACCADDGCLAVIYYTHHATSSSNISNCHLLDRTYNKELQCLPAGAASAPVVANRHGDGVAPSVCPKASPPAVPGASVDADVLLSWAWALGRGASDTRPPHTWIPFLRSPEQAECAASALRAYGHVANPDHTEKTIPDVSLYGQLYTQAAALDKAFAGTSPKPVRYAAVVHSERARNAIYASPTPRLSPTPESLARAWKELLYPAAGMWQTLVRSGVPGAIVPDWLLEQKATSSDPVGQLSFKVLLAPAKGVLENTTEQALQTFEGVGVTVIRADLGQDWEDPSSRERTGRSMLDTALAMAGDHRQPRVSFPLCCPRTSEQPLHVVAYDLTTASQSPSGNSTPSLMIHVLNDFAWCSPSGAVKVPPPAAPPVEAGTKVIVRDVHSMATATEVLTGTAVAMAYNGSQMELTLPSFRQSIVVRVDFA